jgi:fatty acid desaturase
MHQPRAPLSGAPMTEPTLPDQLYRASHYGKVLKNLLPKEAFEPQPGRLAFGLMHMAIVVAMGAVCVGTDAHVAIKLLAAAVAGQSWAILGFFAHEMWHGSVLKSGLMEHWLGMAFSIIQMPSATGWKIWHNGTHHKHTNIGRVDPDAMPYLEAVRSQPLVRFAQRLAPGYGGFLSYFQLLLAFTFKNRMATYGVLFARDHGNGRGKKAAIVVETILTVVPWLALFYAFGWQGFWLLYVVPLAISNVFNMLYIYSNHHLNPRTFVNDPLINSLTVTAPRFIQWFHGNFGYHVEHHIFPSMSPRYAAMLHRILIDQYGGRYQHMPFLQAVKALYATGTCYHEDGERLVHAVTGEATWTLREGRRDFASAGRLDVSPIQLEAVKKRSARTGHVEIDPAALSAGAMTAQDASKDAQMAPPA